MKRPNHRSRQNPARSLHLGLRIRYVLAFVALALVPLGLAVSMLGRGAFVRMQDDADARIRADLDQHIQSIADEVQVAREDSRLLARLLGPEAVRLAQRHAGEPMLVQPSTTGAERVLGTFVASRPGMLAATLFDATGRQLVRVERTAEGVRVASGGARGIGADTMDHHDRGGLKAGTVHVSDLFDAGDPDRIGVGGGVSDAPRRLDVAAPVFEDGLRLGTVIVAVEPQFSRSTHPGNEHLVLARPDGTYLVAGRRARAQRDAIGQDWPAFDPTRASLGQFTRTADATLYSRAFNVNPGGVPRVWLAGVASDGGEIPEAARMLRDQLVVFGGAVAVIAALLALFAANRISGPLVALVNASRRIQSGDGGVRLKPRHLGDLEEVGRSFNGMVDSLARKNAELSRAKDVAESTTRAKSEFLANMSHEIRTPMNGVLGMLELLEQSELPATERGFVRTAKNSAEALLGILNDILDFSKIEAGKLQLESIDFDARELAEEVTALLAKQAHAKGIELLCVIPVDAMLKVRGDPTRLRQVLVNLVGNALKFTQKGEVVLGVEVSPATSAGIPVRFEVRDTGIGMSPEALGRLFRPFTQADSSTTRRFGGTGLGLAITHQLVTLMGGTIQVESVEGQGSRFAFSLVLPAGDGTQRGRLAGTMLSGLRALVVDDNTTNREIVEHHLRAWGVDYVSAAGGWEAFGMLRDALDHQGSFDIILLDYHMPGMDGLEFSKRLGADPHLQRIPRLLLSSSSGISAGEMAAAGIAGSLPKPLRARRLYETIAAVVGRDGTQPPQVPAAVPTRAARAGRVLLVEDNPVNQKVALVTLRRLGHDVQLASNGIEGLAALAQRPFDLVLMDCQMPEMDGFAATRALREREKVERLPRMPVIALTANALEGDREQCLAAGMDDYLTKPFKQEQLKAVLDRWLDDGLDSGRRVA